jgi:hypothetical protein
MPDVAVVKVFDGFNTEFELGAVPQPGFCAEGGGGSTSLVFSGELFCAFFAALWRELF